MLDSPRFPGISRVNTLINKPLLLCIVRLCVAQGSEFSGDGYTDYQESVVNDTQKVSTSKPSYAYAPQRQRYI